MAKKSEAVVNLYDMAQTDPNKGYSGTENRQYLNAQGQIVPYNYGIFIITEYIPINPNTEYTLHGNFANAAASAWCIYDAQKNYIQGEAINRRSEMHILTPANAAYIRFSPNAVSDGLASIVLNEGAEPLSPGDIIWRPCAVKRYASGGEQNNSSGTFTYKGLTLIKNRADIEVTGTSTDIISSTDQFFKDNFSVLLEAGKTYTIFGQNTVVDDSYIDIRYRNNDDIITTIGYYEMPGVVTITPSTDTYIYMGIGLSAGVQCSGGHFTVNFYRQAMWLDTPVYIRGRHPNIFDVDSVQNIIRNNVIITSGFSNVDGIITLTKSVGADGRYAYNELLSFEANEVYEIMFDVLLEGTNSSNLISIAVLDPSNMGAVSTDLFNYPAEKDTWTSIAEELTLSATQGALSIQARNTGNRIKIKNVILRKKGYAWNEQ